MINILARNCPIKIKTEWSEITIAEACDLFRIYKQFPENFRKMYDLATSTDAKKRAEAERVEIESEQRIKQMPALYAQMLQVLSGDNHDQLTPLELTTLYKRYVLPLVFNLISYPPELAQKECFEFEGEMYYYPKTKAFNGQEKPMVDSSAIMFSESADLLLSASQLEGGKYEVAAMVVAVLCRKKGETYNEDQVIERAEKFKQLPMTVFWQVFFYLAKWVNISSASTPSFLERVRVKAAALLMRTAGIPALLRYRNVEHLAD